TAVFSIVNAIYFRALPYPAADRLAIAHASLPDPRCGGRCARSLTAAEVAVWRAHARSIDAIGTVELRQGEVDVSSGALVLEGAAVNADLPPLLGLRAAIGRGLLAADFTDGAPGALVLSHSVWQSEFGGDSAVVGQRVTIDGRTYPIVGVLAPESELGPPVYSFNVRTAQYLIPQEPGSTAGEQVLVRMRPGVTAAAVESDLAFVLRAAGAGAWHATVEPLRAAIAARYRGSFMLLLGASVVVLLLTCMNVGGLFVARLHDRLPELATRAVLGASRAQLIQQVLTETALVALAGAAGGVWIGYYGTHAARLIPIDRLPFWTPVVMDVRVVSLAVGLALAGGLLSSIAPALALSPQRMVGGLRALVTSAPNRARARSALASAEIALSVVLFVVTGILVEQLIAAERRDLATARHSVVFVAVSTRNAAADASWPDRVIAGLRTLPHVTSVAVTGLPVRAIRRAPPSPNAAIRTPGAMRRVAVYAEGRADPIPDLVFPLARVVTT
ncbi:MAG: ABC transporter permease, partial [Gemmatimonadaceae bacterium]